MVKKRWVVFTVNRKHDPSRPESPKHTYWTGKVSPLGKAKQTVRLQDAAFFNTAREAYEAAGEHKNLWPWRVKYV